MIGNTKSQNRNHLASNRLPCFLEESEMRIFSSTWLLQPTCCETTTRLRPFGISESPQPSPFSIICTACRVSSYTKMEWKGGRTLKEQEEHFSDIWQKKAAAELVEIPASGVCSASLVKAFLSIIRNTKLEIGNTQHSTETNTKD